MPGALAAAAGALGAGALAAAPAIINAGTSAYWADKNLQFQKRQFKYQQEMNQLQMQREDSAYQRAVRDASAAGLSPLAVSSGAVTGDLTGTSMSGVGNNAGQLTSNPVASAIDAYTALKGDKRADATTNANVLLAGAQAANAQAEAEKNNEQAVAFRFQNGINAATAQEQIDRFNLANQMLKTQMSNIWSNTHLNEKEKEYRSQQVKEMEIKLKSYSDYLQESLNNMRIQNTNQTIQGDILRLDRLFKNYDWSLAKMDKQIDWSSKNKTLFGILFGDLQNMTAGLQNAFTNANTDWFHNYKN